MKFTLLFFLLLTSIAAPNLYGMKPTADSSVMERKIIIYTDNQYSPFEFINKKGEPDGFNVELMRAIMEEVNLDYEIRMGEWKDVINAFDNNEADVIAGISNTKERQARMSFGLPHNKVSLEIITRSDRSIKSIEDLKGKKVIVQEKDWSHQEVLDRKLTDSIYVVPSIVAGVELLKTGDYDALLSTDMVNNYALNKAGNKGFRVKTANVPPRPYSVAVHKGDEDLLYLMNKALFDLKVNGTYDTLYNKWFNIYDFDRMPVVVKFLIGLLVVGGLIMSVFLYVMRCQVKKATADLRESQQNLIEKNNQLNLAFSAGNTVPFVWDIAQDKISITIPKIKEKQKVFDLMKDELTLDEMFQNIHSDDLERIKTIFHKIESGQQFWVHEEGRYDHRKGFHEYFDVYITVGSVDKDNKPVRAIGYLQNITKRKLAEIKVKQNEKFLNEILDSIPFPVHVKDIKNNYTYRYWNKQSRLQFGDALYKSDVDIVGPEKAEELHKTDLEVYETGCVYNNREKIVTLEGRESNTLVQKSVINIANERMVLIVRWSIDELLDLQHHLEETNEILEKAKDKAERSDRLKSAFLANMSHEIRTPLNAIVGFSQLMKYAQTEEERENYDRVISFNNELLLKLINDILDLAKIEAGYIDFKKAYFDVATLMYELRDSCLGRVQPGVELVCDNPLTPCFVDLDRDRVAQLITNFVTNAAKFTKEGSIHIGYELEPNQIQIYVRDTGIGIKEEHRVKIFERFEKGDSFAQGTGLGLSICKSIAETAGGEVGVDSILGKGSTFWVILPLEGAADVFSLPDTSVSHPDTAG
ncbi:MAG: transporter substrate-binding domain-containing protein [Bacteroidales bacterium]